MQTCLPVSLSGLRLLARKALLPLLVVLGTTALPAHAALLEYWNFNNDSSTFTSGSPSRFGSFATTGTGEIYNASNKTLASNASSGAIYTNGVLDLSGLLPTAAGAGNGGVTNPAPNWGVYSNSTANQAAGDGSLAGAGGSLGMANSTGSDLDTLLYSLDSAGYSDLSFSSAIRLSVQSNTNNSYVGISWSYSLNGTTWTSLDSGAITGNPGLGGSYSVVTLDLPSLLDNASTFYLKESLQFGTTAGSLAIDNIQLTGTAVPEPSTWVLLGAGLLFLLGWQRRRIAGRA